RNEPRFSRSAGILVQSSCPVDARLARLDFCRARDSLLLSRICRCASTLIAFCGVPDSCRTGTRSGGTSPWDRCAAERWSGGLSHIASPCRNAQRVRGEWPLQRDGADACVGSAPCLSGVGFDHWSCCWSLWDRALGGCLVGLDRGYVLDKRLS